MLASEAVFALKMARTLQLLEGKGTSVPQTARGPRRIPVTYFTCFTAGVSFDQHLYSAQAAPSPADPAPPGRRCGMSAAGVPSPTVLLQRPPSAAAMRCTATGCMTRPSSGSTHCRHHDSCKPQSYGVTQF